MKVRLNNFNKRFREPNGSQRILFKNISAILAESGYMTAIQGRSGSGKSTLLRIIAGLDTNYEGNLYLNDTLTIKNHTSMARIRRKHIGYMTQSNNLLLERTVAENIAIGSPESKPPHSYIEALLEKVGLEGYARRKAKVLSGGEAQRVAFLRAIVNKPSLLLADEPTAALDEENEKVVFALLRLAASNGAAVIVSTHNDDLAVQCDSRFLIEDRNLKKTR